MERRLTAILAADVVGYSRLMGATESGILAALNTLRSDFVESHRSPKMFADRGSWSLPWTNSPFRLVARRGLAVPVHLRSIQPNRPRQRTRCKRRARTMEKRCLGFTRSLTTTISAPAGRRWANRGLQRLRQNRAEPGSGHILQVWERVK